MSPTRIISKNEEQLSYGNTIVVHPTDPDTVICGGVDLHRTKDGGATWQKITFWDKTPGEKKYAHSDHHCLLMPAVQPGLVYSLNDGGLDVSTDSGKTWVNRSKGLVTSMFYDIDVAQTDGGDVRRRHAGQRDERSRSMATRARSRKETAATAAGSSSIRKTRKNTT